MTHVQLLIEYKDGSPLREPVHAEFVADETFRLLSAPGFVQGIAAGDEFVLQGDDGAFRVLRRSGNLTIQIYSEHLVEPCLDRLRKVAESLGGSLDGNIARGAVLSIPLAATFAAIEGAMNGFCRWNPHLEWYYGNVYDPADGITPLRWWED